MSQCDQRRIMPLNVKVQPVEEDSPFFSLHNDNLSMHENFNS